MQEKLPSLKKDPAGELHDILVQIMKLQEL